MGVRPRDSCGTDYLLDCRMFVFVYLYLVCNRVTLLAWVSKEHLWDGPWMRDRLWEERKVGMMHYLHQFRSKYFTSVFS